ncbi:MAG TPA: leucyl aminopeptidase [Anaeromyxobacter sp.]|nr:leucyl aminopeptidase [Anaeromyxobacter sp.]
MAPRRATLTVKLTRTPPEALEVDALVLLAFEEELAGRGAGAVGALDAALDGRLRAAAKAERFAGKAGQELTLNGSGGVPAQRIVVAGLGLREAARREARERGHEPARAAVGKAARAAARAGAKSLAIVLPDLAAGDLPAAARAAVEGARLGSYAFEGYKKPKEDRAPGLAALQLVVPAGAERRADVKGEAELGLAIADAVAWARDLVNLGPADCTPAKLAAAASALAREAGLTVKVRGPREIEALGMGMFLGVTRGSAEPPQLVQVSYTPKGAARRKPLVLVGKAITFDSGGLSLKPTESMVTMNTDMAGSAAVLAAMRVVATLRPAFPVHAVLGACENMPGGRAYKPSDVLRAYDGTTVEITNTDAEGRLVLGDVLAWAGKTLAPEAMVDVATLTGACMVALGNTTAGLFGPDGKVVDAVAAAARAAGEDVWRLPLTPALTEQLESDRADLKNTGERYGGAITAAHFLHHFAGDVPWAHLDIAGPSHARKERGYVAPGGTGFAVRTLVELVRRWG